MNGVAPLKPPPIHFCRSSALSAEGIFDTKTHGKRSRNVPSIHAITHRQLAFFAPHQRLRPVGIARSGKRALLSLSDIRKNNIGITHRIRGHDVYRHNELAKALIRKDVVRLVNVCMLVGKRIAGMVDD